MVLVFLQWLIYEEVLPDSVICVVSAKWVKMKQSQTLLLKLRV